MMSEAQQVLLVRQRTLAMLHTNNGCGFIIATEMWRMFNNVGMPTRAKTGEHEQVLLVRQLTLAMLHTNNGCCFIIAREMWRVFNLVGMPTRAKTAAASLLQGKCGEYLIWLEYH